MSFFDALHKIQRKPEATRKKILAVTVVVIMSVIVFLWLSSLRHALKLSKPDENNAPGPFSVFKETILKGLEDLKGL